MSAQSGDPRRRGCETLRSFRDQTERDIAEIDLWSLRFDAVEVARIETAIREAETALSRARRDTDEAGIRALLRSVNAAAQSVFAILAMATGFGAGGRLAMGGAEAWIAGFVTSSTLMIVEVTTTGMSRDDMRTYAIRDVPIDRVGLIIGETLDRSGGFLALSTEGARRLGGVLGLTSALMAAYSAGGGVAAYRHLVDNRDRIAADLSRLRQELGGFTNPILARQVRLDSLTALLDGIDEALAAGNCGALMPRG